MPNTATVPSLAAGHAPTATELKQITDLLSASTGDGGLWQDQTIIKTADQSVTSSTTLVNDNDFAFNLAANATYMFWGKLRIVSAATPLFKFGFTVPAAGAMQWCSGGFDPGVTAASAAIIEMADRGSSTSTTGVNGTSATNAAPVGQVTTSVTAGQFRLQFAQAVSNATSATLKNGSWLILRRIL